MSHDRATTQVTSPTSTGISWMLDALGRVSTATVPITARTTKTSNPAHQRRRASSPASAKAASRTSTITATNTGLSQWPSALMPRSARLPGVSAITDSATATTGASRTASTAAVA